VSNEPGNTPIQDRYAQQIADLLKTNETAQQEFRAQMAGLQEGLDRLTREHALLSGMQGAVAEEPATKQAETAEPQPVAEPSGDASQADPAEAETIAAQAVPRPRQSTKKKASKGRGPAKKAAAASPAAQQVTPPAAAPAAKKASPAHPKTSDEPSLRTLILDILVQHHEPRLVSEIISDLAQSHPQRTTSTQVVRNALQALVLKGDVERSQQGRSVLYTALQPDATDAAPGVEAEVVEEAAEPVEEKVAAEV